MKRILPLTAACALAVVLVLLSTAAIGDPPPEPLGPSTLFDPLSSEADVIYLVANSSLVFGPDPHGRSEEVTFVGPVTVPKWPMQGYERRVLADGRQQIDIELTESDLLGESYLLAGPVQLGEHPDLRSLGTITERAPARGRVVTADLGPATSSVEPVSQTKQKREPERSVKVPDRERQARIDSLHRELVSVLDALSVEPGKRLDTRQVESARTRLAGVLDSLAGLEVMEPEVVPADFVVERKVLLTTAKGILYNETAVPVTGRVDAIPPVRLGGTPTGVTVFEGMELPVALLDEQGEVNGWFYSKAHMAYAVKPRAIERGQLHGRITVRSGDRSEEVAVEGRVEVHHGTTTVTEGRPETEVEVMVLALRGTSELLGGEIMIIEGFSDRDRFSSGTLAWEAGGAGSSFDLFVDVYTPSSKLSNREPIEVSGRVTSYGSAGTLTKGDLAIPMIATEGRYAADGARVLYDEAERPVAEIVGIDVEIDHG